MRAIRQSDIDIAKAEVEILRSLGMEPDAEAILLASLDEPPATIDEEPEEPRVEVNGHLVPTPETVSVDNSTIIGGEIVLPWPDGDDSKVEYDIEVLVHPSKDETLMHVLLTNAIDNLASKPKEGGAERRVDVVATRATRPQDIVPYRGLTVEQLRALRGSLAEERSSKSGNDVQESLHEYAERMRRLPRKD